MMEMEKLNWQEQDSAKKGGHYITLPDGTVVYVPDGDDDLNGAYQDMFPY
jgi:hypothetical protein